MFHKLAQLINQGGFKRLNISVSPTTNNRLSVTLMANNGAVEVKDEKLRQALATPLSVEGTVSELEQGFWTYLERYQQDYVTCAIQSNLSTAENHLKAALAKPEQDKSSAPAKSDEKTTAAPESVSDAAKWES